MAVEWVDEHGGVIGTSDEVTETLLDSDWHQVSGSVVAPDRAYFARLLVSLSGAVDDRVALDRLQMSNTSIHYHDPQTVTVACGPSRANLITDPNFEVGCNWTAALGAVGASTAEALFGSASAKLEGSPYDVVPETIPAYPNAVFTFSGFALGDGTQVDVEFRDSDGVLLEQGDPELTFGVSYPGTLATDASEEWTRFEVSALAPSATDSVSVRFSGQGALYLDAVMLERSERARAYFDPLTGDQPAEDVVTAVTEGHVYSLLYPSRFTRLSRLRSTLPYYLPLGVRARILLWDSDDPIVTGALPYGQ